LYTQVHCLRHDQVLLMKRHKEPNLGLWVAPGGKIEADEAPYECAIRELREETGLQARETLFRGIVSIVMPALERPCMQFLYVVTDSAGELVTDEREGALRWWPVDEALRLPMPSANALFLPHVLDVSGAFYQAKYTYDAEWRLLEAAEHSLRISPA
jgi:8-oxo-dGTP diphosphatase